MSEEDGGLGREEGDERERGGRGNEICSKQLLACFIVSEASSSGRSMHPCQYM